MDERLQDALDAYLGQPINFGPNDSALRLAEEDAFRAGWAAHAWTAAGVTV